MVIEYSSPHKDYVIPKKNAWFFRRSKPFHFPAQNARGRKDLEIITATVTQTWKLFILHMYYYHDCVAFKTSSWYVS